jgi:lipopolysaccharide transport system ATP-binding protein
MTPLISVQGLCKQFHIEHSDRPNTLQELLQRGPGRTRSTESFWAVDDVSFTVEATQTLGVIGSNGAGKSTLLRLVGGVGRPDKGTIDVHGRIGCLLDLGAGFHPDLTGRENIHISGVISGLSRRQVYERFDEIVEFSELRQFIDNPLRTYSTGMYMRLAFAVASHINPEILLIDEVLSVGDLAFQNKCLNRIESFRATGCATLLVSHQLSTIRQLCDEVMLLDRGRIVALGSPDVVIKEYSRRASE